VPRRFYFILTLTTLLGAFLRLWQLTSVPPGLHFDLAATALLGNDVAFHGSRPIFIAAYTGHEVLFYYWLALWFRLIGSSIFTLRLAAALLGTLTIPATFFAVREVMRFEEKSLPLAAFAAIFLSFAFFHVVFSRFGFRVITEPLIQCLALGFLFRGLNRLRTSDLGLRTVDFGLAGLFTGLAAYTYLAARLFPVPLAVFWLALLLSSLRPPSSVLHPPSSVLRPSSFVLHLSSFVIFTLSALLTFAPLGFYFLQHPEDFLNRFGQVAPRPGETALILQGIRRAAEMIFINGEPYDRFNIPELPLFGPVLGFFFIIGLAITIHNLLRPPHPVTLSPRHLVIISPTNALLLSWLPAMLLPTALSIHDIFPSNVRAFGLIPLLFVFPARGVLGCWSWVVGHKSSSFVFRLLSRVAVRRSSSVFRLSSVLRPSSFVLTLTFGFLFTFNNYFNIWANLPNQRLNNDADLVSIANYLNAQAPDNSAIFVSALYYRHPTLAYLARDYNSILWLTEGNSLVIPQNRAALYLFARAAPPPEEWIKDWDAHLVAEPRGPDSLPDFRAYRFVANESPPLPEFMPLTENFGNILTLTGYRFTPRADQIFVDLRWRVENLPEATDFLPYARLYDAWGEVWSQSGGFSYPSEQWSPGDTLLTRLVVPLTAGLPPGSYTIKIGLYSQQTQINLPRLDVNGHYAGDRAPLPEIQLTEGLTLEVDRFLALNPMSAPAQVQGLDGDLVLLGYTLNPTVGRQGERLQLTLFWHARQKLTTQPLTIQLADQTLFTGSPVHNTFPFSDWAAGQVIIDHYALKIPPNFAPGSADLKVNIPNYGSATLTTVEVKPVERVFTPPEPTIKAREDFNHEIALAGYDLKPGAHTTLTLFWKSLTATNADYTVFVHVLDASGQVIAQTDAPPRGGAYPTLLWVPGEFIADDYAFDLTSGTYTLEVGLYLPETGERLSVFDVAGNKTGSAVTLPAFQVP